MIMSQSSIDQLTRRLAESTKESKSRRNSVFITHRDCGSINFRSMKITFRLVKKLRVRIFVKSLLNNLVATSNKEITSRRRACYRHSETEATVQSEM